jgi:hypothetical protein
MKTSHLYLLEFTMSIGAFTAALFEYKYMAATFLGIAVSTLVHRWKSGSKSC